MNNNLTREELIEVQYSMLQELHNYCTARGIVYYLAFGTLIGAVRHKGFIPWDDDVDIMMTEKEFEKLRQTYKSDRYFITDCFHSKKHQLFFPRIYDSYTCRDDNDETLGVFIDIYIIHGAPNNQIDRARHAVKVMRLKKAFKLYTKWRGMIIRHFLPSLWNHYQSNVASFILRKLYRSLSKYSLENSKIAYPLGGYGMTEMFWKDFLGEPVFVEFNGGKFYAPTKYHEILSTTYGDYMKLPPEEDRHPYHGSSCYYWKNKK